MRKNFLMPICLFRFSKGISTRTIQDANMIFNLNIMLYGGYFEWEKNGRNGATCGAASGR